MRRVAGAALGPAGAALGVAEAVPLAAEVGRERGAGRNISDPNAGNVQAGDLRPGQLGAIRSNALTQARGESLRAAYADPTVAEQNIGSYGAGVQRRAADIALANTPAAPVTIPTTGRPGTQVAPQTVPQAIDQGLTPQQIEANVVPRNVVTRNGNDFSGRDISEGFTYAGGAQSRNPINVVPGGMGSNPQLDMQLAQARSEAADRGDFGALGLPGQSAEGLTGGGATGIGIGALPEGAQRSGHVTALNADAFDKDRIKYLAEQSLRLGGRAGPAQARAITELGGVQAGERQNRANNTTGLAIAQGANAAQAAIAGARDRTDRRGQDIQAGVSRDVANIGSEGRIEGAIARADRPVLVGGGQEPMYDAQGMFTGMRTLPQRLVRPSTGEEIGAAPKASAQPTPRAQYDKMPKGAKYIGPDGKTYTKG